MLWNQSAMPEKPEVLLGLRTRVRYRCLLIRFQSRIKASDEQGPFKTVLNCPNSKQWATLIIAIFD
jgi:hypothetical protein